VIWQGRIVTPEGFPLAYEVMSGNTSDKTTLKDAELYDGHYLLRSNLTEGT
jgi:hypothetical protein